MDCTRMSSLTLPNSNHNAKYLKVLAASVHKPTLHAKKGIRHFHASPNIEYRNESVDPFDSSLEIHAGGVSSDSRSLIIPSRPVAAIHAPILPVVGGWVGYAHLPAQSISAASNGTITQVSSLPTKPASTPRENRFAPLLKKLDPTLPTSPTKQEQPEPMEPVDRCLNQLEGKLKRFRVTSHSEHEDPLVVKLMKTEPSLLGSALCNRHSSAERAQASEADKMFSVVFEHYSLMNAMRWKRKRASFATEPVAPFKFDTLQPVRGARQQKHCRLRVPTVIPMKSKTLLLNEKRGLNGKLRNSCKLPNSGVSPANTLATDATLVTPSNTVLPLPEASSISRVDRSPLVKVYSKRLAQVEYKEPLCVAVLGDTTVGKSTVVGRLLFEAGYVSNKEMNMLEWEAKKVNNIKDRKKKLGQASHWAFVLDQSDERARRMTLDVTEAAFKTANKRILLLDCPGHPDLVGRTLTALCQADACLLVVSAVPKEFESSFTKQTQEHATLARLLGIPHLVVAVNKMDVINWDQVRFNDIRKKLTDLLCGQLNYRPEDFRIVPVSGRMGQNLSPGGSVQLPCTWCSTRTLWETLVDIPVPANRRLSSAGSHGADAAVAPFRFLVTDVHKPIGSGRIALAGRVLSGGVSAGVNQATSRVVCLPSGVQACVKSIRLVTSSGGSERVSVSEGSVDSGLGSASSTPAEHEEMICDNQPMVQDQVIELPQTYAFVGDQVSLVLAPCPGSGNSAACLEGQTEDWVSPGSVLCDADHPLASCSNSNGTGVRQTVRAQLLVLKSSPLPLTPGFPVVFHHLGTSQMATIGALHWAAGKGKPRQEKPRFVSGGSLAEVNLILERPVPLDVCDSSLIGRVGEQQARPDSLTLGRFVLRSGGVTVAGGNVMQVNPVLTNQDVR